MRMPFISEIRSFLDTLNNHELGRLHKFSVVERRVYWYCLSRLCRYPILCPFIEETNLLLARGMTGATANFYFGLADFEEMSFLLHFLRQDDVFGDIGANTGVYSILASGVVGARSIAMEPSPEALRILYRNVWVNNLAAKMEVVEAGAGSRREHLNLTVGRGAMNRFAVDGIDEGGISVLVRPLDEVFQRSCPALLKIDVEGAEDAVIAGASSVLTDPVTNAIVIEWPSEHVDSILSSFGFQKVRYNPRQRILTKTSSKQAQNIIYVRDFAGVQERLSTGRSFSIFGETI